MSKMGAITFRNSKIPGRDPRETKVSKTSISRIRIFTNAIKTEKTPVTLISYLCTGENTCVNKHTVFIL